MTDQQQNEPYSPGDRCVGCGARAWELFRTYTSTRGRRAEWHCRNCGYCRELPAQS